MDFLVFSWRVGRTLSKSRVARFSTRFSRYLMSWEGSDWEPEEFSAF